MINQYQKSLLLIFLLFSTILLGKNKKTLIEAQDDTYTVTYSTEPQTVGSVYDNDHYGTATPTDKEVQFSYVRRSTDNNGKFISTAQGGMLRLPAGLAEGRHYVYYKIRDIKDATHSASATATVIVLPQTTTPTTSTSTTTPTTETPTTSTSTTTTSTTTSTTTPTTTTLTAQDDIYTVTYSTEPQIVGSVYDNDRYGTQTPTDKEVQFSYVRRSTDDNGKYISTTRGGMLHLPADLAVGRHYVHYKIRDIKDVTHFATATATVIVLPQTTTPTTSTATTTPTTTTSTTITLSAQDDTYTVTYSAESQLVGSVYDNDRYGTQTPTDKEVQFSYVRRSIDDNGKYISTIRGGMLRLPAGLSVGRHYIYYKIRDIKDITHFATATATVIVLPQTTTPTTSTSTTTTSTTTATTTPTTTTLTAQDDTYTVTYSTESQLVGSVYDNDRYGTQTPTDKEVQFSYIRRSTDNNGKYISTIRGGMLRLPGGLSVGRHYVYYKIRDIKDATHFATATATVIVLPKTTTPTTETPTISTSTTTPTTTTNTTITLTAQDDTYTVTYSTESQLVGSVYDNDHYGTATPTDKEVQFSYVCRSTDNNGKYISTIRGGMLRLPAGLSVGHHYVYYKIRDIKDITNFATATATVIVLPQTTTPTTTTNTTTATTTSTTITLTAQDDTYTVTYSNEPQTVGSVYDNDHYGTATPTDKEVHFSYVRRSTDNNGKYISTTQGGMLHLPADLAVGRHYVYYKIRDIKDATHFATATATVIVLPQTTTPTTETPTTSTSTTTPTTSTATTTPTTTTLTAQDDIYTVTYSTEPQTVGSVYDNDRYGTATPTDKEVQFSYVRRSTDNNGKYISTIRGGMLRLPAGLSVGRHYIYYKIRDIKDVTNFATATATVIVLPQTTTPTTETPTTSTATTTPTTTTLTAQDDTYTVTYSTEPQIVGSVYDNDRYGTATPTDKEVQFSYVRRSTDDNGKYISTVRGGMLRLPAGLAEGRHYVYYKIIDIKDATHSATATATVIVLPQTTTPTTETPTTSTATTTPTTTTLTAQDDTYTVTYSTEPQIVGSVYNNDHYGTATPTDKEVQFSYIHRSTDNNGKYISTTRGGMLHLPADLAVGRHYVHYKIRDIKDVTNFATATATVIVLPQTTTPTTETPTTSTATTTPTTTTLTAQDDTYTVTYSTENQLVGSVYDNDRYGTATPTDKEVQFSYVRRSTDNNGKYISTTRGGMLRLPAGLAEGRHYVYYKIRDIKDITHFATATATVIVLPQTTTPTTSTSTTTPTTTPTTTTSTTITLTAQDDTYTVTYSTEPQMVGSVYDNDRYGTTTPTDKEVQFSYVRRSTDDNGKYISTIRGGMLRLPAGLSVGRHYVYYKIRDIKDVTHSATATATVIVLPKTTTPTTSTATTTPTTTTSTTITLTAQDDTYTVTYSNEPQLVGSVYDNDRYGTATPTDKEVQFSYVRRSTDNNGKFISTAQGGMLRLPSGLAVGRHYVYYKIRDIKDVTHFATATATVIVLPQTTTPTTKTPTTSTSTTTPTTITNTTITLTAQDDTYTVTYSTEPQIVGSVYDNDHYGTATPTDKDVQFSYIRRSTDDNGKYISTVQGGMLRLPAGLAEGRHYVYYKIRDIKDITHFATATATVIVLPQTTTPTTETPTTSTATTTPTTTTLTAQDDTYTVTYSTEPQMVGSVYDNDHYGTATPTDKEVQFSYVRRSTDNNGKYISTAQGGMLRLPAGLSVGHHYVYYKIRDIKDVTNFATATATVIVQPQITTPTTETPTTSTSTTTTSTTTATTTPTTTTLTAQDDTYTVTYSTESQIVGSVYDNDHYGTATPTDKEVQFSYVRRSTDDNGKYISTIRGGMLRLPAGLSVGRHYIYYKIRDIKDVTNFATAIATVIVLPQTTTPTTETPTTSTATTTPTTTTLTAQDDTYTVTYSTESQLVGSVYDNDRYGTQTPTDKEVHFSYVRRSTDNNGKFISTAQGGMLRLPAGLSVGRHYVYYKIRDIKDITHSATATATVIVLPQTTTPTTETPTTSTSTTTTSTTTATTTSTTITLIAQDDTYTVTYSTDPQIVGSVYENDRYGTATPTDKEVQFSYIRRSTDNNGKYVSTIRGGMLQLPAGLSVGRHYVYYKIRDIKDATHSATATATVIVLPQTTTPTTETPTTSTATTTPTTTTLTAQDDTYTVTYSTEPQIVGSVYDNDRYGTATPTDKEVQFSYVRRSTDDNGKYISTVQGGMLRLPAALSVGHHYVYYKIRDIKDVTHFATATATVIVLPKTTTPTTETPTTSTATTASSTTTTITLTAQDDTYTVTYSTDPQIVGSVYENDRYGTATPTDKEVQFSYIRRSTDNNGKYVSTIRGGMLQLPAGLSVGRHYIYYKIRDIKDITHSATATATVIVLPKTTTPTTETPTTEEPLRPIAVADAVTTPMNTPVLIAILQNDIPYDAVPYISAFPYKGSVTLNDSNEVLYTPNNNTTGADSFTYELRSPDAAISLATTTVTVKIWSPITPCTGISANGDGKNDYFHIMGIENYPENTLTIYDSNANKVFSVSHYDNEVCRFEGANLPQGVYFFVLTYRDEDDNLEQQVGWFYLKK